MTMSTFPLHERFGEEINPGVALLLTSSAVIGMEKKSRCREIFNEGLEGYNSIQIWGFAKVLLLCRGAAL